MAWRAYCRAGTCSSSAATRPTRSRRERRSRARDRAVERGAPRAGGGHTQATAEPRRVPPRHRRTTTTGTTGSTASGASSAASPHGMLGEDDAPRAPERRPRAKRAGGDRRAAAAPRRGGRHRAGCSRPRGAAVRALVAGSQVRRPRRLALVGYEPVQERRTGRCRSRRGSSLGRRPAARPARLPAAPLLRGAPPRRRRRRGSLFVAPDPAIAFGEKHEPGRGCSRRCRLSLERDARLLPDRGHAPLRAARSRRPREPARHRGGRRGVPPRDAHLAVAGRPGRVRVSRPPPRRGACSRRCRSS